MEGTEENKIRGRPKGQKRTPKVPGAPKQPLSGYVHFANERREKLRKEYPECSFAELSKKLASEWARMSAEEKSPFTEKAEKDKERYTNELAAFRKSDAYKNYLADKRKAESAKIESSSSQSIPQHPLPLPLPQEPVSSIVPCPSGGGFDVPIFTQEFLEVNKARESELRALKKSTAEVQERNSVLERHVDNLHSGIRRLERESVSLQSENQALEIHFQSLRDLFLINFQGLALKKHDGSITEDNLDDYVKELFHVVSSEEYEDLLPKISDVASKIDISSLSSVNVNNSCHNSQ
ncbi:high mobility group protein 20A [Lepeophtheirus salmonis]|uniref:high mobility group protein 20A n=1 Tax=Lepeophtheirus salmonis TaxID=72036 RepID=UPI001AE72744|nr:high mobility group protein 20A-like [Lepeophtheirus salmonis]